MAIFNKPDQQTNHAANITTVAAGTNFTGKIEIECSLHVDGELSGEVKSTNTVSIGKSGVVKCELTAQKLIVAGKFFGNAECESVELLDSGEIEGQLTAASLAIDAGGSFQGQSNRKKPGDGNTVVDFAAGNDSIRGAVLGGKEAARKEGEGKG